MTMRLAVIAVATAVAMPVCAGAQVPVTLADAQAEARAHAPDPPAVDALVRGAEVVAAQAPRRLRQKPEIAATYGPGALAGRPDELSWTVTAALPVDVSGSWKPRAASADADLSRARREREEGLRTLDERVAEAVAD